MAQIARLRSKGSMLTSLKRVSSAAPLRDHLYPYLAEHAGERVGEPALDALLTAGFEVLGEAIGKGGAAWYLKEYKDKISAAIVQEWKSV